MKKTSLIVIIIVIALLLSACKFFEYQKAVSLMNQANFQEAHEIFLTIIEYKDCSELANECLYQMAMDCFNQKDYETARGYFDKLSGFRDSDELVVECIYQSAIESFNQDDYETAYNFFLSISGHKDSLRKSEECSVLIGYQIANEMKEDIVSAVSQRDEAQLCQIILSYSTMEHAHDEISVQMNAFVMDTLNAQFEVVAYDNYLFLDRVEALVFENELLASTIGSRLLEFDAEHEIQRAIAFLTGTWKRVDSSQSSGLRIGVTYTEENSYAMILEDLSFTSNIIQSAEFHWEQGFVVWNNIQITDPRYITMDIMWLTSYYNLGVQSVRYEDGVGYLDYDGMRVITQSTGEDNPVWSDNFGSDIYVKESAIKEVPELSVDDFLVSLKESTVSFESGVVNLNNWFDASNKLFYAYNDINLLTTARGISVGSEWATVVEQYGYGPGNLYVEENDLIYDRLRKSNLKDEVSGMSLCDVLSAQADEYMEYSLGDTNKMIRFYFNDGLVSWICLYTV
ncbi:MAG: tetratricopeptide repeat protein [Oscillospiraceae bacterium]|nr:tetratricopeptide repeat protein [Oscillospiraceae bacterium]